MSARTDDQNAAGPPAEEPDSGTDSDGATDLPDTTDENDRPVDNPSG